MTIVNQNDHRALIGRHGDRPVLRVLRTDGDQILLLCQPVRHVQEDLAVALDAERAVASEVAVADDDDARFGLGRVGRRGVRAGRRGHGRRRRPRRSDDRSGLVALVEIPLRRGRVAYRPLMSVSAQLCGLVSSTFCAVWPLTPPSTGVTDRASGNAVITPKFSVIGCGTGIATGTDASVPISWPRPLASMTMSLPTVDAPVVGERDEIGRIGRRALVGRIEQQRELAAALQEALAARRFPARADPSSGPRSRSTVASSGTLPSCASVSFCDVEVVASSSASAMPL